MTTEGGEAPGATDGSLPTDGRPTPEQIEALAGQMREVLARPAVRHNLASLLGAETAEGRRARRLAALADEVAGMRLVTRWEPEP